LHYLLSFPAGLFRALRLVHADRYDVVYTNTVTVLEFAIAARLRRVPHVWHLRESAADNPQLRSPLPNGKVLAVVRALSARVIYNSRYLVARYGALATDKEVVVYNGVPPQAEAQGSPVRAADGRLVVVTAGFMDRRKGLDVLLDAVTLLPGDLRARMVLRVAGDIQKEYMAGDIVPRLLRLGGAVEVLGRVDGIGELLTCADLLVSSARDEPFGRTLVEAMMAGVAVLATRSGGPEEIVVDGTTGVLVPAGDPQQLSTALARLLHEPEQLRTYGQAGRERAAAQFSLPAYVRGVEQCLLEAISGPCGPTP
jgi:glycosyltransferase involved in cell wall biosynthesis